MQKRNLQNQVPEKPYLPICRHKIKSSFGKGNLIEKKFFLSITVCVKMFRSQPYLEKNEYVQVNLDSPITLPGNNQTKKVGLGIYRKRSGQFL